MPILTQAPDPHPKTPKLACPPGACDTHIHLFGPAENTIVLDHFAGIPAARGIDQPAVKAVLRMLDSGRVWLKLSGPMRCTEQNLPYPEVTPLARAFVRHAPERMVWGSDWPHVNLDGREMANDGDLLDLLAEWVPDEKTRNRILVTTPARFTDFHFHRSPDEATARLHPR